MDRREILNELEALVKTPSGQILSSWYALDDVWLVVEGNGGDVVETERKVNSSPPAMIEIMSDANVRERLLIHFGRLLHNFLASAVAVDDQTTDHVTRFYRRVPLHTEFDRRRAQVLETEPLCSIIPSFRNVALHQRLLTTRVRFQVRGPTSDRSDVRVKINNAKLR